MSKKKKFDISDVVDAHALASCTNAANCNCFSRLFFRNKSGKLKLAFNGGEVIDKALDRADMGIVKFKGVSFSNVVFDEALMGITEFYKCQFTNCQFNKTEMGAAKFRTCRFLGCDFSGCELTYTRFNRCYLMGCEFGDAILYDTRFSLCNIIDSDLILFQIGQWPATVTKTHLTIGCQRLAHERLTNTIINMLLDQYVADARQATLYRRFYELAVAAVTGGDKGEVVFMRQKG